MLLLFVLILITSAAFNALAEPGYERQGTEGLLVIDEPEPDSEVEPADSLIISGRWLPPFKSSFVLDQQTVILSLLLDEEPPGQPFLALYAAGDSTNLAEAEILTYIEAGAGELTAYGRGRGKRRLTLHHDCYNFLVTADGLALEAGQEYLLVVMVGDALLYFENDEPAAINFTMDNLTTRWEEKLNID
jgi:hypothetical protein